MTIRKSHTRSGGLAGLARRTLALGAVSVIAAGLAACASDPEQSGSDGPIDLRMLVWTAAEPHLEIFNEIAEEYIEENPEKVSSIIFEPVDWGNYFPALTTQIAGNDAPDLAWVSENYARQFVEGGALTGLTSTFDSVDGYNFEDIIPSALDLWSQDGEVYAYPFSNTPAGVYVNLDVVQAAGQPAPRDLIAQDDWTWDRLADVAAATAQSQGVSGIRMGDPFSTWHEGLSMLWPAWGGAAWSEDGTKCLLDSPETVSFFEWFHEQVFESGAIDKPGVTANFAAGEAAYTIGGLSLSSTLTEAPFEWDFVPLPAGPDGDHPIVSQGAVAVLSTGKNQEIAADFLAYFTNAESAAKLSQFFPPPRKSVLTLETLSQAAPGLTEEQIQETVIDQALVAETKQGHPQVSELIDPVRIALDQAWVPDGDVEKALVDACAAIEPILAAE